MIRVGVGGWNFAPWCGTFYPKGLPHAQELAFASRRLTSIEVNGTFYRTQTPEVFRKWADETPDGFVFSLKGPRYVVSRSNLGESGSSIERFIESGIAELGPKLGPLLWQFAPTKKFVAEDLAAFLALLPKELGGRRLRHVIEPRHDSFRTPELIPVLREHGAAVAYADSDDYPAIPDVTADFIYARLQRSTEDEPAGYPLDSLDLWAKRFQTWAEGGEPDDLPRVASERASRQKRDCFVYFISGAKVRNPAAALTFIEKLGA